MVSPKFPKKLSVDIVIDHIERARPENGVNDPGFQALLRFMETGRCWVKISAPYLMSTDGPPHYAAVGPKVRALVSVRPDRLVWAGRPTGPTPITRRGISLKRRTFLTSCSTGSPMQPSGTPS
jgi:hypothetical protein